MKPGRELDALIAEKVMGLELKQPKGVAWRENTWVYAINDFRDSGPMYVVDCDFYSTDISAAWEVVDNLRYRKIPISIAHVFFPAEERWEYIAKAENVQPYGFEFATSDSAPHAICLAALKAVGYEAK